MTMHGVLSKISKARLYASRNKRGRGLHSVKTVVHQKEQSPKIYVSRKAGNDPLMAECKCFIATWKKPGEAAAWYTNSLHDAWHKGLSKVANIAHTCQWFNNSNIRVNTEARIMAAQEQAFNTRAVAHEIYYTVPDLRYRLCKQHAKTAAHIISGCSKLTGTKYTEKHSNSIQA